ncbi:MAG: Gfo/Idh/MocA family oxidoreductase [Paracoccaceae bacterium]|nr:Gfo/Idh/MocA family oxidoreductase [Paracoccaceae bacterium]
MKKGPLSFLKIPMAESTDTLGIGLLGSGRMAHVYGPKLNSHPGLRLEYVLNPNRASAERVTAMYGGRASSELEEVLDSPKVDAVVIATPTNTHVDYIAAAAMAGKSIYCEKPLDNTLERVDSCLATLKAYPVPFMLGFNRRFDPDNAAVRKAVANGELGKVNFLMSTSREPAPPPIDYVRASGGYFLDAQIHDIDLLCWIAGERPEKVFSAGSCVFDPDIGAEGDVDLAMTTLMMPSGAIAHINNSRACIYGFDQRLEVFGTEGMLQTSNHHIDPLIRWSGTTTEARAPLKHFFLERYDTSFYNALDEFYGAVTDGRTPSTTEHDGRAALAIALACKSSQRQGVAVAPDY